MNRSLTGIGYDHKLPPILLISTIFKYMCLTTLLSDESNPPMDSVKLMVSKVHMVHESIELLPSGECYDLSTGNNDPTENIMLVLVGIPIRNQPDFM